MLAVRKLLLADDSITIQKIVALTFADEGIEVIAVGNGADAIEKLEEITPDVVLADVFMPRMNGYQVCEHIKQTGRLKHIPVMLMVGSFEPLDEAEARRVGADDILTKPFQSIRTLMDKVGALLGRTTASDQAEEDSSELSAPAPFAPAVTPEVEAAESEAVEEELPEVVAAESEAVEEELPEVVAAESEAVEEELPEVVAAESEPVEEELPEVVAAEKTPEEEELAEVFLQEASTQELPPPEIVQPPEEPMSTAELEMTTADTQPLSPEILARTERREPDTAVDNIFETETMRMIPVNQISHESSEGFGDALLELDHFEAAGLAVDEVILDVDFDTPLTSSPPAFFKGQTAVAVEDVVEPSAFTPEVVEDSFAASVPGEWEVVEASEARVDELVPGEAEVVEAREAQQVQIDEPAPVDQEFSSSISEEMLSPAPVTEEPQQWALVAEPEIEVTEPQAVSNEGATVTTGSAALEQLSPEVIDAIARRVVEQLSEKVIQEIAWEVVPQLAELMIKRKLEEQEAQKL